MTRILLSITILSLLALQTLSQTSGTAVRWYRSAEVDGSSTGTHTVGTTVNEASAERDFHIIKVSVILSDFQNVLVGPVISIGTNNSDYNNIVTLQSLGGSVDKIIYLPISSDLEAIPKNTDIKVKVTTACTGSGAVCKFFVKALGDERVY